MNREELIRQGEIVGVCEALRAAWSKCPELRLGQLIVNATSGKPTFYVEDESLIECLNKYVDRNIS